MGCLCKPVNYDPDRVKSFSCLGQSHNEIHTDIFPFPCWDWQGLQWSSSLHMYRLDTSTSVTFCHIVCDFNLHLSPPIMLFQVLIHLSASRVNGIPTKMSFVQDLLTNISILWHNYAVFEPYLSHPVLEGKPNANHVRARIRNSRTQRLHK
jgi:hypothetical protein